MAQGPTPPFPGPVHEGLYQNVYRDKESGRIILSVKWYESPRDAESAIMWENKNMEYLYTAKVTSGIHKFERP